MNVRAPSQQLAYRPKQAAAELGIGLATLYRRIKAGDIRTSKFGGATLISHDELVRVSSGAVAEVAYADQASIK